MGAITLTETRHHVPIASDQSPRGTITAARRREKLMANKPVIGYQVCPHCGGKVPVIWDGNRKETCMYCKKQFRVQRQRLKNTMRVKRPPEGDEDI